MAKMRAGALDEPIEIQYQVKSYDATYGTPGPITWTPLVALAGSPTVAAPVWAQFQDVLPSRDERVSQGVAVATNRARIRIRYRSDITAAMRVRRLGDSTVWMIVGGPSMIGRKEWTEFVAERHTS